tara:strand:+ start:68 stop:262 length:195 start_codon:yes stop_codon:yes gene_type:complete
MGLIDKLIDKVFDSIKKGKTDAVLKKAIRANPELKKSMDDLKSSSQILIDKFEKIAKEKGIKLK